MALDQTDIKIIREESEDIKRELGYLNQSIKDLNANLNSIVTELIKSNVYLQEIARKNP
jgi:septal ring factor EnvC (AmiA/AmiB activator)